LSFARNLFGKRFQASFDISQTFSGGELGKTHYVEMIPADKGSYLVITVKSFFEMLSFFLRYRLPLGYISAVGVGGDSSLRSE
jgi:hypothetical protein